MLRVERCSKTFTSSDLGDLGAVAQLLHLVADLLVVLLGDGVVNEQLGVPVLLQFRMDGHIGHEVQRQHEAR